MTTIAYKDGIVAFDSYITAGELVVDFEKNKCQTHKGVKFIFSGKVTDEPMIVDAWFNGSEEKDCDASALVIANGKPYYCAYDETGEFFKYEVTERAAAYGSGSPYALGAMDNGASAVEAVKIACNRDVYSGGRVRKVKV